MMIPLEFQGELFWGRGGPPGDGQESIADTLLGPEGGGFGQIFNIMTHLKTNIKN
jgi:hypothetical protein